MKCISNVINSQEPEKRSNFKQPVMSDAVFQKLGQFIQSGYGIKMPPVKKTMLQSRLHRRLRRLNMVSFHDYCKWIFSEQGESEIVHMVNAVSTNKTDFFREPDHFDFLEQVLLPEIGGEIPKWKRLLIWSAGCSTGEEPYTLAMVMEVYKHQNPSFNYHILATDLSTRVLDIAKTAIYPMQKIDPIPVFYRKKFLLKSRDDEKELVRIVPEIRRKVQFERMNFMQPLRISRKMDMIFCRNVMIYFERDIQKQLIRKMAGQLKPYGYLFLGHSETLTGFGDLPFVTVGPNIYQKTD